MKDCGALVTCVVCGETWLTSLVLRCLYRQITRQDIHSRTSAGSSTALHSLGNKQKDWLISHLP